MCHKLAVPHGTLSRSKEASCAEPISNSRDSLTPHIRLDRVDDQAKDLLLQLDSISLNERQVLREPGL